MINKPIKSITKADIDALITEERIEDKTIEYKEKLPGNDVEGKKKFLYSVSSFANASGGDLIYGIEAERDERNRHTGRPESVPGLEIQSVDSEIGRLESLIRDGISPNVPGLDIFHIEGFEKGPVIIIRVAKSWIGPHIIRFKNDFRFYSRNSNGKYRMDLEGIRAAVVGTQERAVRIRSFRDDRLGKIIADEAPINLPYAPKAVLHLIPIEAIDGNISLDLTEVKDKIGWLDPLFAENHHLTANLAYRLNLDGLVFYEGLRDISQYPPVNYLQLFRKGIIESVDSDFLAFEDDQRRWGQQENGSFAGQKKIRIEEFERDLVWSLTKYMQFFKSASIPLPVVVLLSLVGVKDYTLKLPRGLSPRDSNLDRPIDRDVLALPEIVIDDYETESAQTLKPIFDSLWQSAGWFRSHGYKEDGSWAGVITTYEHKEWKGWMD